MNNIVLRFRIFLYIFFFVIAIGTIGFMRVENLPLADAFYFSIVTVSTVGYGDITPVTKTGKILALLLILTGVGTFLGVVANATDMMLSKRDRRVREQKLNMIKGVFFSETGTDLLRQFIQNDRSIDDFRRDIVSVKHWTSKEFQRVGRIIRKHSIDIDIDKTDFISLKSFLNKRSGSFLRLLENPSILEHEEFSELLWAIMHLKEELLHRDDFSSLPDTDYEHLKGDIMRAYSLLALQWISYMTHLKDDFPYLFSLALRINPFNEETNPVVLS